MSVWTRTLELFEVQMDYLASKQTVCNHFRLVWIPLLNWGFHRSVLSKARFLGHVLYYVHICADTNSRPREPYYCFMEIFDCKRWMYNVHSYCSMNKEQIHSFNVAIPLFNPIANEIKSLTGIWINLQHIPTAFSAV